MPTNQQLFTPDDFINIANDEMETVIVPLLMSVREEYFLHYVDLTATPQSSGPIEIEIPADAVGMKIRDILWVDPSTGALSDIPRLTLEQLSGMSYDFINVSGFTLQGNKILLYPGTNQSTGMVRMYYIRRPLQLCSTSNAGQVITINTMTNELTLSFVPNSWAVGDEVSIVGSAQPFATRVNALEVTAISSPTITVTSVEGVEVGDWVALTGFSPIPQIPIEAHKVLAQAACVKCLEAMGDREGMQVAEAKLQQNTEAMLKMINPRVDGSVKKVTTASNGIFEWSVSSRYKRGLW